MQIRIDRDAIARDWAARGFTCDVWVDPPGKCWEGFVHGTDEVILVLQGELEIEFAGTVLRPAPGEEVLIPARTVHALRNVGEIPARWLYGYRHSECT